MKTERPFFIVGSPRSGTTLLQAMFMAAPGLYLPPETHLLPILERCERRHGAIATDVGRRRMVNEVLDVCARHEIPIDAGTLAEALRTCPPSQGDVFDTVLAHIQSERPQCRRLGEKSPAHLVYVPQILDMFPDAQVITIIRDARDVVLSQERALGRNTLRAALGWRRDQRLHAAYSKTLPPDRYTSVRYEDLVRRPEQELRRLCSFLDEPFTEAMLQPHRRSETGFAAAETHKAMTLEPITVSRIGRFRVQLSPPQIALVEAVTGAELRRNDYELLRASPLGGYLLGIRQLPKLFITQFVERRSG